MTKTKLILCFLLLVTSLPARADEADTKRREQATVTIRRAAEYFRTQVATHGGYVYHYALDLDRRWGEGEATKDQIWVQPPGTPTVGLAYVAAYQATGDRYYLEAIEEVATALRYGQLKSGGWTNCIDFDPQGPRVAQYRNGRGGGKNHSSLDDGQTQTAIRFMIQADAAFEFKNAAIHESAKTALDALQAAQFASGGFPQVWTGPHATCFDRTGVHLLATPQVRREKHRAVQLRNRVAETLTAAHTRHRQDNERACRPSNSLTSDTRDV